MNMVEKFLGVLGLLAALVMLPSNAVWGAASWDWKVQSQTATNLGLHDVSTNGAGVYVAVGQSSQVWVSNDSGVTWANNQVPVTATSLHGVVWHQGVFVAVGSSGGFFTSTNGTTWVQQTNPSLFAPWMYCVASDGTTLVAFGSNGAKSYVYTSTDGVTWAQSPPAYTTSIREVYYDTTNKLWIAAGSNGLILTSTDGLTWNTAYANAADGILYGVASSAKTMVVTGWGVAITSTDGGVTWTRNAITPSLTRVVWSGVAFVAGSSNGVYTSPDGVSWTYRNNIGSTGGIEGIVWGGAGTEFVAVGTQQQIWLSDVPSITFAMNPVTIDNYTMLTPANLQVSAADNINTPLVPVPDQTGPLAVGGPYTVAWTATDAAGYTFTASQNVTVVPGTPPASGNPGNTTPPGDGSGGCMTSATGLWLALFAMLVWVTGLFYKREDLRAF